jgi:hypothetical protein
MNLNRKTTGKGCVEYVDADMRGMPVPLAVPPGFSMYRVCGNQSCLNAQHCYFVDGDTTHKIEIEMRELMLTYLRNYFKVDHDTLQPLEPQKANGDPPKLWLPKR